MYKIEVARLNGIASNERNVQKKYSFKFQNKGHSDLIFVRLLYGIYVHLSVRYEATVINHVRRSSPQSNTTMTMTTETDSS